MASTLVPVTRRGFGQTSRRDRWWLHSVLVFLGLSTFLIYANWAAWQGNHYTYGPYLSPFYSPEIWGDSEHAWFGPKPAWYPAWLPFSPALLILWAPGLFRVTCYYYRGAYYKAFWADPPSCAVGEPRHSYLGENSLPLILHNVHRYFFYIAVLFLFMLSYDVWKSLWWADGFHVGLGSLILAANTVFLSCYTLGCHSARHLSGGCLDQVSSSPARAKVYNCVSCLNAKHQNWAWTSLFSVMFSDIYVRLCSMGMWSDWRIL